MAPAPAVPDDDQFFPYIFDADDPTLERLLRTRGQASKPVILAEIDRRKTQAANHRLIVLTRWVVFLALITSVAAIITMAAALHVRPF